MEPKEQLATKKDLEVVERTLSTKIDKVERSLDAKIDRVEKTLDAKIDRVEKTLDAKIDKVEKTLSGKIEENTRKIEENTRKIEEHTSKIEENSRKIEENSRMIEENSRKIDRVAIQVIKNSEAINNMVTRDEFNQFRNEILSGQDKMITILIRLDQERIFTNERIRRIEEDVEMLKAKH